MRYTFTPEFSESLFGPVNRDGSCPVKLQQARATSYWWLDRLQVSTDFVSKTVKNIQWLSRETQTGELNRWGQPITEPRWKQMDRYKKEIEKRRLELTKMIQY